MTIRNRTATSRNGARDRPPRPDARQHLLAVAGEVFAEKGVDAATGQEICQRAGMNSAAINYYFGGMERLYEAVILEAISLCPNPATVPDDAAQNSDPIERLRAVIAPLINILARPRPDAWIFRLLMREFISPSPVFEHLVVDAQPLSQARMLKTIVAEIMGLPVDHPAVAQGCICALAPVQIMIVGQHGLLDRMYPEIEMGPANEEALAERVVAFALGGLEALARTEARRTQPDRRR